MDLGNLYSIINDYPNTLDTDRAFTFIEFIKLYGGENTQESFLTDYQTYLSKWAKVKKDVLVESEKDFVREKLVDILKTITLTYSSYEEQQFIASIDWTNKEHLKAVLPLYVRKIREICEFYRKKRVDAKLIVKKHSQKGSYRSIEQIIYETIIDFIFNNRNLQPQMAELKENLMVSIEQYVDTYSEYFDIPRDENLRIEKDRELMIEANMTDIDYRNYIEINTVINEILYTGEVYLDEIGLMATLALDFSQECVGEMLELKNQLISASVVNQIPLNEQIALRRKFYEKYLGCDLYYMFVDANKNVTIDLLCTAKNPSGNLLNCDTADRAVTQNEELTLLSHIGLFFKPDKTSILKINAHDYSWSVNEDALVEDTIYVFPDPSKYGNYGNNKNDDYPLIMEYKLDHDIRNLSSGYSNDDPLILIDEQAWHSYYSKQQDIFKIIDNKNYDYSFSSLSSMGYVYDYQIDVYGNEFGLFKGYGVVYGDDGEIDHVEVPEGWFPEREEPKEEDEGDDEKRAYIINGGYFEDPYAQGYEVKNADGTITYIPGKHFDYERRLTINDFYHWTALHLGLAPLVTPSQLYPALNFGNFVRTRMIMSEIKYYDHFRYVENYIEVPTDKDDVVDQERPEFRTEEEEPDVPVVKVERSYVDLANEPGYLYLKNGSAFENRPQLFGDVFTWLPKDLREKKIISFVVRKGCVIFETEDEIVFAPYKWTEDSKIDNNLDLSKLIVLPKGDAFYSDLLWNEKDQLFYITVFNKYISANHQYTVVPIIYKFNPVDYTFNLVVSGWELSATFKKELDKINLQYFFAVDRFNAYQAKIKELAKNTAEGDKIFFSSNYNMENFNFSYQEEVDFDRVIFSYNNNLGLYLLAYLITDNNGLPHIYEHKFRMITTDVFNKSLTTNVYGIGEEDDGNFTVYNEGIESGFSTAKDKSYFFKKVG